MIAILLSPELNLLLAFKHRPLAANNMLDDEIAILQHVHEYASRLGGGFGGRGSLIPIADRALNGLAIEVWKRL